MTIDESMIQIHYENLPYSVGGCVTANEDGSYTIFINARLPEAKQREALSEELIHIGNGHFIRDITATYAEQEVRTALQATGE